MTPPPGRAVGKEEDKGRQWEARLSRHLPVLPPGARLCPFSCSPQHLPTNPLLLRPSSLATQHKLPRPAACPALPPAPPHILTTSPHHAGLRPIGGDGGIMGMTCHHSIPTEGWHGKSVGEKGRERHTVGTHSVVHAGVCGSAWRPFGCYNDYGGHWH